ncbi:MAG TPA: hypothetical protein VFS20_17085, partial [Longimicrobium sp.]|nr:hypothetical protein [Longimicrobium sp.]
MILEVREMRKAPLLFRSKVTWMQPLLQRRGGRAGAGNAKRAAPPGWAAARSRADAFRYVVRQHLPLASAKESPS